ncbi:MAG TPA: prolyl oligopeptidase family serine peptidase [Patescibacteria group bacterium]|nr:prolyl oligopeptidase family serine peptidase [Patescibacteria group bacterium]
MKQVLFRIFRVIIILSVGCPLVMIIVNYFNPIHPAFDASSAYYRRSIFSTSFPYIIPYMLFVPNGYDATKKYPLVLVLHGSNKDALEAEILTFPDIQKKYPSFIVMPLAPFVQTWALPDDTEFQHWSSFAMPYAMKALSQVEESYSIDRDRVYITGVSSGGFGVFGTLIKHPDDFAAAIVVSGGWVSAESPQVPHIPIRIFHSDDDPQIPVSYARGMAKSLNEEGGNVKYKEYTGLGHAVKFTAFANNYLWDWLFAQKRGVLHEEYGPPTLSAKQP